MRTLQIRMLDGCEVIVDGEPITNFRSSKALGMMLYLAFQSQEVTRDRLSDFLWPPHTNNPSTNFRKTLSRLRKALNDAAHPEEPFLLGKEMLSLSKDHQIDFDVWEFQSLVEALDFEKPEELFSSENRKRLERAAELYRHHFLAGGTIFEESESFQAWLTGLQRSLSEQAQQILTALTSYYEYRGQYPQALTYGYRLLELEPHNEEYLRQVMALEARRGSPEKALGLAERSRKSLLEQLELDFSHETEQLLERIQNAPSQRKHNLNPLERSFVGRSDELVRLQQLLFHEKYRLISVLGPGGIGKSTLVRHLGRRLAQERFGPFMNGVFFVTFAGLEGQELSSSEVEDFLLRSLAEALSVSTSPASGLKKRLLEHLANREVLLILDNAETVVTQLRTFLNELLSKSDDLKLLITTREQLKLRQEQVFELRGFELPDWKRYNSEKQHRTNFQSIEDNDAISLFLDRAQQENPSFLWEKLDEDERFQLVRICQLVDGMPLALELAAAWTPDFSCRSIAEELSESLEQLQSDYADADDRHRSVEAAFTTTWERLSDKEKRTLQFLSVFHSSFSRKAAESISGQNAFVLRALRQKSLLETVGQERYRLHKLIRMFASRTAGAEEIAEQASESHLEYYSNYAFNWHTQRFENRKEVISALVTEENNIRQAWDKAISEHNWSSLHLLKESLSFVFGILDKLIVAVKLFEKAQNVISKHLKTKKISEKNELEALQNFILIKRGEWLQVLGQLNEARKLFEFLCVQLKHDLSNLICFHANQYLGSIAMMQGEYERAISKFTECLRAEKDTSLNEIQTAFLHMSYGSALLAKGDFNSAEEQFIFSQQLYEKCSSDVGKGHCYRFLGRLRFAEGRYNEAEEFYKQSIQLFQKRKSPMAQSLVRSYQAQLEHLWKNNSKKAKLEYERSLRSEELQASHYFHSDVLQNYGGLLLEMGRKKEAQEVLSKALSVAKKEHLIPVILSICHHFARVLSTQKKYPESYSFLLLTTEHPSTSSTVKYQSHKIRQEVEAQLPKHLQQDSLRHFESQKGKLLQSPALLIQTSEFPAFELISE